MYVTEHKRKLYTVLRSIYTAKAKGAYSTAYVSKKNCRLTMHNDAYPLPTFDGGDASKTRRVRTARGSVLGRT